MGIRQFRKQHNELKSVVSRVLPSGAYEGDAIKEINAAYDEIKDKEVLLLSKGGGYFCTHATVLTSIFQRVLKCGKLRRKSTMLELTELKHKSQQP